MTTEQIKPTVENYGLYAEHNMPCAVRWRSGSHAVLDCGTEVFHPSWRAQADGWRLVQAKTRLQRLVLRWLFPASAATYQERDHDH